MQKKKKPLTKDGGSPSHFFEKYLAGQPAPDALTMFALFRVSMQFGQTEPWMTMMETEVFAVDPPGGGPRCYCSVLGSGGELFRLIVYRGDEGFGLYERMRAGKAAATDLYTAANLLYVDYVRWAELTAADKAMLEQFGAKRDNSAMYPQFRAIQKGFRDWYVNAQEASDLMECLRAGVVIIADVGGKSDVPYWQDAQRLPKVQVEIEGDSLRTSVEQVAAPHYVAPPIASLLAADEQRLAAIRAYKRSDNTWELGSGYFPSGIGQRNQRPGLARISFAIDADSNYAFHPALNDGSAAEAQTMADALMLAMDQQKTVPRHVLVASQDRKAALAALTGPLGISVGVKKRLPGYEHCMEAMEAHLSML